MISVQEVTHRLYGAYRLARLDVQGMQYFDTSIEHFWRSFYAAVVAAPGYLILVLLHPGRADANIMQRGWFESLLVHVVGYVLLWVTFPFVMYYVTRAMQRSEAYVGYICAYNWAKVLQSALLVVVAILTVLTPAGLAKIFTILAFIAVLAYQWYIAKTTLKVGGFEATGLVLINLVLSLVIRSWTGGPCCS